jgi:DNA-binding NtrC family response regulator
MNGSEFLVKVRNLYPETIRIILTAHQNIETAINAINGGEIHRFLNKPCHEAEFAITIRQALKMKGLTVAGPPLLEKTRQQSPILQELQREYPGISEIKGTFTDAVIKLKSKMNGDTAEKPC